MEDRLEELLNVAIKKKVSDIHFTLRKGSLTIEFRHKQKLVDFKGTNGDDKLMQYLQYRANLQMGNSSLPQSGQFEMEVDKQLVSLRYSIIHSPMMSNGVLRILNHSLALSVNHLSEDNKQNELFESIGYLDHGLILFAGPTSSGKTTTLYTVLDSIKNRRIFTIEDPIEILKDNYVQLQVNPKMNIDYEQGIKQILRHDPDIIMIGEIRDEKTAKSAVRAALTGHLVMATIHATSGVLTIERLLELLGDTHLLMCTLKLIVNQRLVMNYNETRKVAYYEVLTKKELDSYFHEGKISSDHIDIQTSVTKAIKDRKVSTKTIFE